MKIYLKQLLKNKLATLLIEKSMYLTPKISNKCADILLIMDRHLVVLSDEIIDMDMGNGETLLTRAIKF